MNCPYCDENVHPQAKFCAKCGLPMKEDTTVHGVSATDDAGPSKYVVALMLGGILILGILVVWVSGMRRSDDSQAKKYQPPVAYRAPGMGSGVAGTTPASPAYSAMPRSTAPGFSAPRPDPNTTSQTRYVYTPPPRVPTTPVAPPPSEIAPPVPLQAMTAGDAPRPGRVSVVAAQTPRIPRLPDAVAQAALPAETEETVDEPATETRANPDPDAYVWDPVHETWAKRPEAEARRRRAQRARTRAQQRNTNDARSRPLLRGSAEDVGRGNAR